MGRDPEARHLSGNPFGGGQLKRIFETLNAVRKGGVYTLDAEGEEQLQYPVYNDTWEQTLQNAIMGLCVRDNCPWDRSGTGGRAVSTL